jgi:plasmid maintenance system antidote protein VapI
MRELCEIYNDLLDGNSITNDEAIFLRKQFEILANISLHLGDRFSLAFYEANRRFIELDNICKARGIE